MPTNKNIKIKYWDQPGGTAVEVWRETPKHPYIKIYEHPRNPVIPPYVNLSWANVTIEYHENKSIH